MYLEIRIVEMLPMLALMYLACWDMLATMAVAEGVFSMRPSLLWSDDMDGKDDLAHSA